MSPEQLQHAVEQFKAAGGAIQIVRVDARKTHERLTRADDPALVEALRQHAPLGIVAAARELRKGYATLYRIAERHGIALQSSRQARQQERARLAPHVRRLAKRMRQEDIAAALGITRDVLRHIANEHRIDINSRRP